MLDLFDEPALGHERHGPREVFVIEIDARRHSGTRGG
jgi:hypothetical protein